MDDQAALDRYVRLMAGQRAAGTVRTYAGIVRTWLALGGRCDRLDSALLTRRLGQQRRDGRAPATINQSIKALRSFYQAMALLNAAPEGEADKLPRLRRIHLQPVRWLDDDQVARLLAAPDVSTFTGFRDAVMLRTLWESGVRASELVGLQMGDVLDDALYVASGKGGRTRYAPASPDLVTLLQAYIALRGTRRPGKAAALWVSMHGKALRSRRSVWAIVNRHARAALGSAYGYDRLRRAAPKRPWTGTYPHLIRASFATTMFQHGCPLTAIMQFLGHASLDSTARYLGVDLTHLRAAIEKHPRAHR